MFKTRLKQAADATEAALDGLLSPRARAGEIERPARLLEAMRYAALGPGKRLRPFLLIETAWMLSETAGDSAATAAAALECVHAYSLVHDDLPAMDDDDTRRGRPTAHVEYDEATAILAGDGLLTIAFEALGTLDETPAIRIELVTDMARAAGIGGMVGGQALDLDPEAEPEISAIITMQAMKTGALIRYAVEAGAVLGRASDAERERLVAFGTALGRAFQIADDLIDATGDPAVAGKATAKDAERGKRTLVGVLGVDAARTRLTTTVDEAIAALAPFGDKAEVLRAAARFVAERDS